MVARKASSSPISVGVGGAAAPRRPVNPTWNAAMSGRSPRQWSGSSPTLPISVCVIIGPFIGCQSPHVPANGRPWLQVSSNVCIDPCGSPRSHASVSIVASTWQRLHDAFPSADVRCESYRKGRPVLMTAGVGSKNDTRPSSTSDDVSITETVPSKRFKQYRRLRGVSIARPVGPCPTSIVASRVPERFVRTTLFDPMPLTYAELPSAFHTMARGSLIERWRSVGVAVVLYLGFGGTAKRCWFRSTVAGMAPMFAGSNVDMRLRANWKRVDDSNRVSFGPYVPTTAT